MENVVVFESSQRPCTEEKQRVGFALSASQPATVHV